MTPWRIVLLSLGILIILWIVLSQAKKKKEDKDKNVSNIGNYMSCYFFHLGNAILEEKDFTYPSFRSDFMLEYLPRKISYQSSKEMQEASRCFKQARIKPGSIQSICDGCEVWHTNHDDREYFWRCMKPIANTLLSNAFIKAGLVISTTSPVIHFRCADIPFIRHTAYHLPRLQFFSDVLKEYFPSPSSPVILLACHDHSTSSDKQKACMVFSKEIVRYLKEHGYQVEIRCKTTVEDFALLFYAPLVISTVSSFSFCSGYMGNGIFVSPNHQLEDDPSTCNVCPWSWKGYRIDHNTVSDYMDTDAVIKHMHSTSSSSS